MLLNKDENPEVSYTSHSLRMRKRVYKYKILGNYFREVSKRGDGSFVNEKAKALNVSILIKI